MIEEVGDSIVLVGTAHVSARSVEEVERTIRERRPDQVHVELDPRRLEALQDPEAWRRTDLIQVIRQRKQHLFLLQLYLASMQARIGRDTGVSPGAEMLRAVQVADEVGAEVVLIDRDVSVTLKRGFAAMGFWQRLRLFWKVWMEILTPAAEAQQPLDVDALLETDAITAMTEEFARFAPQLKTALIDERDAYMAAHVAEARDAGRGVVAVVGAGHVPGILRHLGGDAPATDREALERPPQRRLTVGKVLAYALPLAMVGVFVYLVAAGRYEDLRQGLGIWILYNGVFAALGALLARGHILSVLTAFVASPLTSLNPALAAGWFAGAVQAKVQTPTVADFEAIKQIETLRGFWKNGVVRVLLVAALANLGSWVGAWVAGYKILEQVLGGG